MPDETPKTEIVNEVETGGTPKLPGRPGAPTFNLPAHLLKLRAEAEQEYVSGGASLWAANYLRTLSFAVDDITADFGDDLYERMLLDGQVSADLHTVKMSVLAQGVSVVPAVDAEMPGEKAGERKPHPDYAKAKEIADFVSRQLGDLTGTFNPDTASPLYWAIYDLMDGFAFGNRVAEQLYVLAKDGPDAGKICLKALKVKPRRSLSFVVDVYNNVLGLLAIIPGVGTPSVVQGAIVNPESVPNLLPRRKFAVLSFRPKNGDPRGQSLLRPAYDPWFVKQQIKVERLKWLAQLAGGSIVGYTPPQAEESFAQDADGNYKVDDDGNPIMLRPESVMLQSLLEWRNGAAAVFPNGAKVEVNYPHPESPFDEALDRQDREISTAILLQTRMTHEAEHGSKADSETGQDVAGLLVTHCKMALLSMLILDVVLPLVEYSYGREGIALMPKLSLSRTQDHDFAEYAKAISELYGKGYLAPSQMQETDALLGLPIRSEAEAKPPPAPMPPGEVSEPGKEDKPEPKPKTEPGDKGNEPE